MKNRKSSKISLITQPNTTLANKTGPWRTTRPETDYNTCISCALCSKICPEACITMLEQNGFTKPKPQTALDYCKGCGLCAKECPVKAIRMVADY